MLAVQQEMTANFYFSDGFGGCNIPAYDSFATCVELRFAYTTTFLDANQFVFSLTY